MKNLQFDFFNSIINSINLEILEHGHLLADSGWKYYNINSPFNRLYFIMGGDGYVENEHHRVLLEKGNVYLVPLHSTYNYTCDKVLEKFYIHFRTEVIPGQDIFEGLNACVRQPADISSIMGLVEKAKSRKIEDIVYCKACLLQIIARFIEPVSEGIYEQIKIAAKYKKLCEYIKNNCSAGITAKELADQMNMSVSNLSKSFKYDTGVALKEYVNRKLVQKAKEKLLLSDMNIKEIAFDLDFADEFYFSRFFKKYTGFSPREYRRQNMMK